MGEITGKPYYLSGQIRTENGNYTEYQQDDPELSNRLDQAFYQASAPIIGLGGKTLGEVAVYDSDDELVAQLDQVILEELLTILALSATLSMLLVAVFRRYFVQSIVQMDSAIKDCDEEGIPRKPVPVFRFREIALLGSTINTMLDSIRDSRETLKIERRRLENTITGTRTGTWEWNVSTGETLFNERWAEIVGYTLEELAPISIETWMKLAHPEDLERSSELLEKHFSGELPYYECEARMRHKLGHWVWVLDRGRVLSWSDDGKPLMMHGTHQDISQLKQNEEKLRITAHYDALTGLPNRLLLSERLRHAVSMARRHGDLLAVVFLDLDGFKAVNDSLGHAAGDQLLIALARRMQKTLRECDTIARLGGDEFVILLPELTSLSECQPILTRLMSALSDPVQLDDQSVRVSASLGVSVFPQSPDIDPDILLRQADMAMYQAKQRGKNQVRFFDGVNADAFDTRKIRAGNSERPA
ncbi:sensor domain-containing diguanylate cyclase [Marinobacter salsuginis]|nr:sensor domain-containing diguanylate cyclase [Marinobacter salsuginis]